jgi:cell division protein ZapA
MGDKEFLDMHIEIAGKPYGLRIKRAEKEEEIVRKAAKQIKAQLGLYQMRHPKLAEIDWIAMVALELSIENLQLIEKNDTKPFIEKIQQITNSLEACLKENN